jgi:hypothetical protein
MASHSYYDWQLSTLMLAYDVVEPISRHDVEALARRQQSCEEELHAIAHAVIPDDYRANPQRDFPPEIVQRMTVATITRAAVIVGLVRPDEIAQP